MSQSVRTAFISFVAIAFTWAALIAGRTHAEATASQIQNMVDEAIRVHEKVTSIDEWRENKNHPSEIFKTVSSESVSAEVRMQRMEDLCKALNSKDSESLVTFDEILDEPSLTCAAELKARLAIYWQNKTDGMKIYHQSKQVQKLLNLKANCGHQLKALKPTIDRPVDIAKAPYFVYGELPAKHVTLTFDDGPHPTRSKRILDTLITRGQRANYFQVGQNAKTWPLISKELADQGQVVGSHSMTHRNLASKQLGYTGAVEEIRDGMAAVEGATGISIPFFRFPYGASTRALKDYLKKEEITGFYWSIDSLDWKIKDPAKLFERIVNELKSKQRGIMLFHDVHEQTAITIPHVLEELEAQGFQTAVFVPGSASN